MAVNQIGFVSALGRYALLRVRDPSPGEFSLFMVMVCSCFFPFGNGGENIPLKLKFEIMDETI